MRIELDIGGHCIQTSAKQAYERMLNRYLKRDVSDADAMILEKKIEGIVFFLKNADFSYLRAAFPDLDGSRRHTVLLDIPQELENMKLTWDAGEITPQWKSLRKDSF
jgi:hypothetical protein